ncbi:MAG: thioredoxin family protein [Polaromonas sp.]|nr:thioredoxin family protein [Polaromonas sp.]
MPPPTASIAPAAGSWVVCLCADWCGVCRDYRAVLQAVAASHPHWGFAWIDIEDEADLVGDLDIETFPTLLIADAGGLRFLGPLLPQAQTLVRLLASQPGRPVLTDADAGLVRRVLELLRGRPSWWLTSDP